MESARREEIGLWYIQNFEYIQRKLGAVSLASVTKDKKQEVGNRTRKIGSPTELVLSKVH